MKQITIGLAILLVGFLLIGGSGCKKKGDGSSAGSSGTPPAPTVPAPSNLTISLLSTTYYPPALGGPYTEVVLSLKWVDQSENETGFEIQRQIGPGDWILYTTVDANVTGCWASQTSLMGICYYRVRAYNSGGYSNPSPTVSWIEN